MVAVDSKWRKFNMRTTLKRTMATLMATAMMVVTPMTAFAAEPNECKTDTVKTIEANGENSEITPFAYYDPASFTFWGSNTGSTRWYDGGHMAAEITASSSTPGLTMQVTAHIVGKGSVTWNVKVDGKTHKKDWISFGTNSGRNVYFSYSCSQNPNAKITVHNKSYSW